MMRYPLPRTLRPLVWWVLTGCFVPAAWADQPNLIFILTDDQRYDTLGVTGDAFVETPHLDQLANDGVLFANASVNSAICTPSCEVSEGCPCGWGQEDGGVKDNPPTHPPTT